MHSQSYHRVEHLQGVFRHRRDIGQGGCCTLCNQAASSPREALCIDINVQDPRSLTNEHLGNRHINITSSSGYLGRLTFKASHG